MEARSPVWDRQESRRRSTLSREAIVEAAIRIADAEGIEAVSIRRVATELGVRTMSLYTYIEAKEDLLDLMIDEVAGAVVIDGELPADWREATMLIASCERMAARAHSWMIELVGRRSIAGRVGPNGLRHLEQTLAALDGLDAPHELKWRLATAVSDYTTGFIVREARELDATVDVQPYVQRAVADGEYPHIAGMLDGGAPAFEDRNFEQGLRWLLDGIAADL